MSAKEIKTGTKKHASLVNSHRFAIRTELRQCYASWSKEKQDAWLDCLSKKKELDGYDMKIDSANGWVFTASFLYTDKETGEVKLYTMTRDNDYTMSYVWEV